MKLYLTPGSCTTGIHILLEELDLVFEAHLINLMAGDQHQNDYLAINPKASIPTLVRSDGTVLTEFQAIAYWLARSYPKAKLLPGDADGDAKAIELMDYAVGTLHGQGFARIFTTEKFTPNPADHDAVKAQGLDIVNNGFAILNELLPAEGYALGTFSIADAALFYVEFWADKTGVTLPEKCLKHYRLMLSRPVVKRVLMEEGYRVD
ncbi:MULTISPECIES: glutathione S-transferase family protein [Methylomonas]|uniref:Glutathione S-transferase n=2 Tax=Methylomonas TaxID=416 RepID=A0A140E5N1_9GAMM|nr:MULTISPECIES: glutathione S-transferase family protein [Methylomonas]AMK78705.1 glutathione S-transferase [Methylomonas denitrificans]OAH96961.1 glutathione S-transferase [Methylomonas methanica]TCV83542.1 glutathione S-transferase [Methylomonas methanica]